MKDKQVEKDERTEKKPYETPKLKKLGSVKQLTQGANLPVSDINLAGSL